MVGTWATISNAPPAAVCTTLLLTDGSVLAQGVSTNAWYRLTPDGNGSYANGTWATVASSVHAPLYYASGILRDGRVIVAGGEYDAGALIWLLGVEMYDPLGNTWTTLPTPAGWVRIGDAPGCVLPDGRFILGQVAARDTAIYDPTTNTWAAAADKINRVGEESWSLLPDGTIHAVDCSNPPNAEKYVVASDEWVAAGVTPQILVDSISEIGASVLLPDGRVFVIGATGFTALYTPPPIADQAGTWVQGPTIPQVNVGEPLGTVDAPAVVLPNGNVLFTAGPITTPATFQSPTYFFEYDPVANTIVNAPAASTAPGVPYFGRLLMLPTGAALYTAGSTSVDLYTPGGAPDPVWVPTITSCPSSVRRGHTYTLWGRQINGLTQCSYYGNDASNATNYPIVRLESTTSSAVYYCRTTNFSTMGLQTGTIVHTCNFTVPSSVPVGNYCLVVIANGIASACRTVGVTNKWFKELKLEIKEKFEIVEQLKAITDATKQIPDIVDQKLIRENINVFERIEDDWITTVRQLALGFDQANEELSRTFIVPDERPFVGTAPPLIEDFDVPKISAARARRESEKRAFNDGREELAVSKQAQAFHDLIHAISRMSDDDVEEQLKRLTRKPPAKKKSKAKKATRSKKKK